MASYVEFRPSNRRKNDPYELANLQQKSTGIAGWEMGNKVVRAGNVAGYCARTRRATIKWKAELDSAHVKGLSASRIVMLIAVGGQEENVEERLKAATMGIAVGYCATIRQVMTILMADSKSEDRRGIYTLVRER